MPTSGTRGQAGPIEQCCDAPNAALFADPETVGSQPVHVHDWRAWESGKSLPDAGQGLLAAALLRADPGLLALGSAVCCLAPVDHF